MSRNLLEHYRGMFDYEFRCTPLVVDGLRAAKSHIENVGLAALVGPFERAVGVFGHVQAARQVWLHRLTPDRQAFPADGVFPVWPLADAVLAAQNMDREWNNYAAGLTEQELARVCHYNSTDGKAWTSPVADILTHVLNHSTYHRGQIASLIAATGIKPPATDFIVFHRSPG